MKPLIAATAPPFRSRVGRTIEQSGRFLCRNSAGSGRIRLVWLSSPPLAFRSGKVTPVLGSLTPASGCATALPALSCQSEKWLVSTPPIETMIRSTSRLLAFSAMTLYRLEPPCSMNAK